MIGIGAIAGYLLSRNHSKFHRHDATLPRHPSGRDDFVSEGLNVFDFFIAHDVSSALNLYNGFIYIDIVVPMLEVQAEGLVGTVSEKDLTKRTIDDIINGSSLGQPHD